MMSRAHRTISETTTNGDDLDVGVVVANIVADVFKTAQSGEISDGIGQSNFPTEGHAGGKASHVLFRDTGIDELLGELFHERGDHAKSQIPDHQNDTLV